jgi:hypothetical protein
MLLQGCVVLLSSAATVVLMRDNEHHATVVLANKDTSAVYAAMIRIVERKSAISALSKEEDT